MIKNSENQQCKKCKKDFTIDSNELGFYEKMKVPVPQICPKCRFQMRAVTRNERTLYNSSCKMCNKPIVTMFNPASPYIVYCNDCWVSDKWDPYSYAMDYDPSRKFFDQLQELLFKVPQSATYSSSYTGTNINSDYANFAGGNKNGYLIFNSGPNNENCAYSRGIIDSRDIFDAYYGNKIENSYEIVNVNKSSGVIYGQNSSDCIDSRFILNCSNCQNCFGCVNLRNKSYYFFNEPLERKEWQKRVSLIAGSFSKTEEARKKFVDFSFRFPRRENNNLKIENCIGDYIFESKNCLDSFEISSSEKINHSFSVKRAHDSNDMIGHCRNSELLYTGVGVGAGSNNVICSWRVEASQNVAYSFSTRQSSDCFGCNGIKNGKFVILNKQYTKEEYEKIKNKIIDELMTDNVYGDFFPPQISFFSYNETIAQDNMPLTKEEALNQGFRWEENIQKTEGKETMKVEDIPDNIRDVPDDIINEVFICTDCGRNYKLIQRELDFYRKMIIPIPRKCWNCRFVSRIVRRGPYKFWSRECMKCQKEIITNYSPDRPEIVYCERCYQQEVY